MGAADAGVLAWIRREQCPVACSIPVSAACQRHASTRCLSPGECGLQSDRLAGVECTRTLAATPPHTPPTRAPTPPPQKKKTPKCHPPHPPCCPPVLGQHRLQTDVTSGPNVQLKPVHGCCAPSQSRTPPARWGQRCKASTLQNLATAVAGKPVARSHVRPRCLKSRAREPSFERTAFWLTVTARRDKTEPAPVYLLWRLSGIHIIHVSNFPRENVCEKTLVQHVTAACARL